MRNEIVCPETLKETDKVSCWSHGFGQGCSKILKCRSFKKENEVISIEELQ